MLVWLYDMIRDAILTCGRKPTRVSLIYRTSIWIEVQIVCIHVPFHKPCWTCYASSVASDTQSLSLYLSQSRVVVVCEQYLVLFVCQCQCCQMPFRVYHLNDLVRALCEQSVYLLQSTDAYNRMCTVITAIHRDRVKWRHKVCGQDTIAIFGVITWHRA